MEKLTKEQMKLIVGGDESLGGNVPCTRFCSTSDECTQPECPTCKAIEGGTGQKYCQA